jgi:hypothetical protein
MGIMLAEEEEIRQGTKRAAEKRDEALKNCKKPT